MLKTQALVFSIPSLRAWKTEMTRACDIRVIGVPRSGTNLTKYLIESYSKTLCCFDMGWWKHGIIPLDKNLEANCQNDLPTIVLFRRPQQQIASFYRFSLKGRRAIRGEKEFELFLSSPVTMYDPRERIQYSFKSPIEYWSEFYKTAMMWKKTDKVFVLLEDLQKNPKLAIKASNLLCRTKFTSDADVKLPKTYMGRNRGDAPISEKWNFDRQYSLAAEDMETQRLIAATKIFESDPGVSSELESLFSKIFEQRLKL